jgi:hypothetical protein
MLDTKADSKSNDSSGTQTGLSHALPARPACANFCQPVHGTVGGSPTFFPSGFSPASAEEGLLSALNSLLTPPSSYAPHANFPGTSKGRALRS